ncbi:MAG: hypothetical protein M5R36_04810 [Deltaproteobacteria bacterium]|nr:hypothetical protein [Deltaproteobacteria bacterium]
MGPSSTTPRRPFSVTRQPDNTSCGPTCLHGIYRFFDHDISVDQVIDETPALKDGGTLAVFLGIDALKRGFRATIYTYNLEVFDPSWFTTPDVDLSDRLRRQAEFKRNMKLREATAGYLEFLRLGGTIRFEDLTRKLLRDQLKAGLPILTGLSSTYLYRTPREYGPNLDYDDVRGEPCGHFVVLCAYDPEQRLVTVADPLTPNPLSNEPLYAVEIDRVLGAILLGVLTYDANLLVVSPAQEKPFRAAPRGG